MATVGESRLKIFLLVKRTQSITEYELLMHTLTAVSLFKSCPEEKNFVEYLYLKMSIMQATPTAQLGASITEIISHTRSAKGFNFAAMLLRRRVNSQKCWRVRKHRHRYLWKLMYLLYPLALIPWVNKLRLNTGPSFCH